MLRDANDTGEDDLEPILRARIRALDEPVAQLNWSGVLARSRPSRVRTRLRYALSATAATAGLAALAVGLTLLATSSPGRLFTGSPRLKASPTTVPVLSIRKPAALDSTLVLYSRPPQQELFSNASGRERGLEAGLQLLQAFPTTLRVTYESRSSPLTNDEESLTFPLYSDPSFNRREGSAFVACLYAAHRDTLCNASIDLRDGTSLTARGVLQADSLQFAFALTDSTGRYLSDSAAVKVVPISKSDFELDFRFV